jgi:hypothetical protein
MNQPIINGPGREIPEKTVLIVPNHGIRNEEIAPLVTPLTDMKQRDWFNPHFYYCLPLTVANRYGFIVRAQRDFTVYWDGGSSPDAVKIVDTPTDRALQLYDGHFGEGIVTVQTFWHFRTPPGVNLMTITPPNMPQHGLMHMSGVIETDNLRRDFTFNLKITKPHIYIQIKAGDPIGAFIPIPRWYADQFSISYADELYSAEEIKLEHDTGAEFAKQRTGEDLDKPRQAGRRYFKGEDAWGNAFPDHQK